MGDHDTSASDSVPQQAAPSGSPADWYPDPLGRAELRYYDGTAWTAHISTGGDQQVDPFGTDASMTEGLSDFVLRGENSSKFTFSRPQWQGTGHLFTEPVLCVQQQGSWVQTAGNYDVTNHEGTRLGSVRQVGQSQAKQLVRAFTNFDKHMTHRFEVLDADGNVMLQLTRPAKMVKSKVVIADGAGTEIGRIVQENAFRKIRFDLQVDGRSVGQIKGTSWSDWDFVIFDADGIEVGRVTKSFQGVLNAVMKGSDSYVVSMHRPLEDPLRQMVIASGVCIDTALHIDEGGVLGR
ncbi:MAG: phospholipid scramblase-related protein [Acidimicrobiales bacterium]